MSVTATISLSFTVNVIPSSGGGVTLNLGLSGTVGGTINLSLDTTPYAVPLPSPANGLLIQNTHATNTLTVEWQDQGGEAVEVITLKPKSFIFVAQAASGNGIESLTLTGSDVGTTASLVIVG